MVSETRLSCLHVNVKLQKVKVASYEIVLRNRKKSQRDINEALLLREAKINHYSKNQYFQLCKRLVRPTSW